MVLSAVLCTGRCWYHD